MMPTELVTLQRYRSEYQPGVVQLILPIQNEEFGIAITAAQQPDLSDIGPFYQQGNGDFWLAQIGERVVGCIGLKDIGQQQTALRKMFVAAPYRGREWGVASALLNTLMMHARHRGVVDIFLGTTAKFVAAHRFYEKKGFSEMPVTDLPVSFPVMTVDTKFYRFTF